MSILEVLKQVEGYPLLKTASFIQYQKAHQHTLEPVYKQFLNAFVDVTTDTPEHYLQLVQRVIEDGSIPLIERIVFYSTVLNHVFESKEQAIYFLVNKCTGDEASFLGALFYAHQQGLDEFIPYIMQGYFVNNAFDLDSVKETYESLAALKEDSAIKEDKGIVGNIDNVLKISTSYSAGMRGLETFSLNGEEPEGSLEQMVSYKENDLPRVYDHTKDQLIHIVYLFNDVEVIQERLKFYLINMQVEEEDRLPHLALQLKALKPILIHVLNCLDETYFITLYKFIRDEPFYIDDIQKTKSLAAILSIKLIKRLFEKGYTWDAILLRPTLLHESKDINCDAFLEKPIPNQQLEMAALAVHGQAHLLDHQRPVLKSALKAYYLSPHFHWQLREPIIESIKTYPFYIDICKEIYVEAKEALIALIPEEGVLDETIFDRTMGCIKNNRLIFSDLRKDIPYADCLPTLDEKLDQYCWIINQCCERNTAFDVKAFVSEFVCDEEEDTENCLDKILLHLCAYPIVYAQAKTAFQALFDERFTVDGEMGYVLHQMGDMPLGLYVLLNEPGLLNDKNIFPWRGTEALRLKRHRSLNDAVLERTGMDLISTLLKESTFEKFKSYFFIFSPQLMCQLLNEKMANDDDNGFVALFDHPKKCEWLFRQLPTSLKRKAIFQKDSLHNWLFLRQLTSPDDEKWDAIGLALEVCPAEYRYELICKRNDFGQSIYGEAVKLVRSTGPIPNNNIMRILMILSKLSQSDRRKLLIRKVGDENHYDHEATLLEFLIRSPLNLAKFEPVLFDPSFTNPRTVSDLLLKQFVLWGNNSKLMAVLLKNRSDEWGWPFLYKLLSNLDVFKELLDILTHNELLTLIKKSRALKPGLAFRVVRYSEQTRELFSRLDEDEKVHFLSMRDDEGNTPLHYVEDVVVVNTMLESFDAHEKLAFLEKENKVHQTPLMRRNLSIETFRVMLDFYPESEHNKVLKQKNKHGESVLDYIWDNEEKMMLLSKETRYCLFYEKDSEGSYFFESSLLEKNASDIEDTGLLRHLYKIKTVYERYTKNTQAPPSFFRHGRLNESAHSDCDAMGNLWATLISAQTETMSKNILMAFLRVGNGSDHLKHALLHALTVKYDADITTRVGFLEARWGLVGVSVVEENEDTAMATSSP